MCFQKLCCYHRIKSWYLREHLHVSVQLAVGGYKASTTLISAINTNYLLTASRSLGASQGPWCFQMKYWSLPLLLVKETVTAIKWKKEERKRRIRECRTQKWNNFIKTPNYRKFLLSTSSFLLQEVLPWFHFNASSDVPTPAVHSNDLPVIKKSVSSKILDVLRKSWLNFVDKIKAWGRWKPLGALCNDVTWQLIEADVQPIPATDFTDRYICSVNCYTWLRGHC